MRRDVVRFNRFVGHLGDVESAEDSLAMDIRRFSLEARASGRLPRVLPSDLLESYERFLADFARLRVLVDSGLSPYR